MFILKGYSEKPVRFSYFFEISRTRNWHQNCHFANQAFRQTVIFSAWIVPFLCSLPCLVSLLSWNLNWLKILRIRISGSHHYQKVIIKAMWMCANLNSHIKSNYCLLQLVFVKTDHLEVINFSCSNLIWLIKCPFCFYSSFLIYRFSRMMFGYKFSQKNSHDLSSQYLTLQYCLWFWFDFQRSLNSIQVGHLSFLLQQSRTDFSIQNFRFYSSQNFRFFPSGKVLSSSWLNRIVLNRNHVASSMKQKSGHCHYTQLLFCCTV